MEISKSHRFIMWAAPSVFLGSLPLLVNFLINLVADNISYYSVLRVNDLMFFVITLSATSMLDLLSSRHNQGIAVSILSLMFLLVLILVAALFLGISAFFSVIPPTSSLFAPVQSRLIGSSLVLCVLALAITLSLEIYSCFFQAIVI